MEKKEKKRGLGRGLSALMADVEPQVETSGSAVRTNDLIVPIERVFANPDQPRRHFTKDQLDELAESIKSKGIIQPLIVRARPGHDGEFEIVAGERRWRAAQLAQLHELPVLVREFDDTEVLEVAIIENIQRADLNAIEEAAGYRRLMDHFGHTQEKLAEALGKSRSHIANLLRLLNLPSDVQDLVVEGKLSSGHARALITSEDASALAKKVVQSGLSVRETEKLAKKPQKDVSNIFGGGAGRASTSGAEKDADTKALEGDLSAAIGMKVTVDHASGQENGKITISYQSLDQLDELCALLSSMR